LIFEGEKQIRIATHCDITREDTLQALKIFANLKKEK